MDRGCWDTSAAQPRLKRKHPFLLLLLFLLSSYLTVKNNTYSHCTACSPPFSRCMSLIFATLLVCFFDSFSCWRESYPRLPACIETAGSLSCVSDIFNLMQMSTWQAKQQPWSLETVRVHQTTLSFHWNVRMWGKIHTTPDHRQVLKTGSNQWIATEGAREATGSQDCQTVTRNVVKV